ncbi:hypothetical protein CKA32_000410 [Geitlerinema sp. FC II]|nr:hypothetical protein CKA32_000410 [Geitlerinema sp. FC II]
MHHVLDLSLRDFSYPLALNASDRLFGREISRVSNPVSA